VAPNKPFFMYFCTGGMHAPHHVPKEWADKYKGKFDAGWDAYANIGELIAFLKDIGEYDNTLTMVISDNGASAEEVPPGRLMTTSSSTTCRMTLNRTLPQLKILRDMSISITTRGAGRTPGAEWRRR
jgi:arylsulfatase A-like enzyme